MSKTTPLSNTPHNDAIDALINRIKPSDPTWEKKSIASFAPHPCTGCGSFILLFFIWLIALGLTITLLTLGGTQDKYGFYIGGSVLLGLIITAALFFLRPVLCAGLPCNLPKPPQQRYPFCSTDGDKNTQTILPSTTSHDKINKIKHTNVYIIYNPVSITANPIKLLSDLVLPSLDKENIKYTLLPTKYAGHARDYLKLLPFEGYSGVLIMGGDGSLFDAINGLLVRDRNNTDVVNQLPIGLLPCGSGNSYSADLGSWDIEKSLNIFINGYIQGCDVNHTQDYLSILDEKKKSQKLQSSSRKNDSNDNQQKITTLAEIDNTFPYPAQYPLNLYSINTCAYGLIGELAVGAENCRFLGTQRYQICGLWGLCKKGYYPTTVIYDHDEYSNVDYTMSKSLAKTPLSPPTTPNTTNTSSANTNTSSGEVIIDSDNYITAFANHTKFFGKGHYISPYSYMNDGYCDVTIAKATRRGHLMAMFNQIPSGAHVMTNHPTLSQYKTKELAFIAYKHENGDGMCSKSRLYDELREYHDQLLKDKDDITSKKTRHSISSSTTTPSDPKDQKLSSMESSDVLNYACQISEKYKNELTQSFITVDGEIYAFYGFLYIKTISDAFQIFIDPELSSLQDAAAQFQEQ